MAIESTEEINDKTSQAPTPEKTREESSKRRKYQDSNLSIDSDQLVNVDELNKTLDELTTPDKVALALRDISKAKLSPNVKNALKTLPYAHEASPPSDDNTTPTKKLFSPSPVKVSSVYVPPSSRPTSPASNEHPPSEAGSVNFSESAIRVISYKSYSSRPTTPLPMNSGDGYDELVEKVYIPPSGTPGGSPSPSGASVDDFISESGSFRSASSDIGDDHSIASRSFSSSVHDSSVDAHSIETTFPSHTFPEKSDIYENSSFFGNLFDVTVEDKVSPIDVSISDDISSHSSTSPSSDHSETMFFDLPNEGAPIDYSVEFARKDSETLKSLHESIKKHDESSENSINSAEQKLMAEEDKASKAYEEMFSHSDTNPKSSVPISLSPTSLPEFRLDNHEKLHRINDPTDQDSNPPLSGSIAGSIAGSIEFEEVIEAIDQNLHDIGSVSDDEDEPTQNTIIISRKKNKEKDNKTYYSNTTPKTPAENNKEDKKQPNQDTIIQIILAAKPEEDKKQPITSISHLYHITSGHLNMISNALSLRIEDFGHHFLIGAAAGAEKTKEKGLWMKALGSRLVQKNTENNPGFHNNLKGFVVGVDGEIIEDKLVLGVAYINSNSETKFNAEPGVKTIGNFQNRQKTNIHFGSIYGNYNISNNLSISSHIKYGKALIKMQRYSLDGISLSKTHGDIFRGKIDASYAYNYRDDLILIPQISISYDNFKIQNFKEEDLNTYIKHKNISKIASHIALKIKKFTHYNKFDLAPYLNFNIDQTLKMTNGKVSISSGDATPKLVVNQKQTHIPKTTYTIGIGTSISKSNDIELGVGYDYSFRSKMHSHSYFATLKLNL